MSLIEKATQDSMRIGSLCSEPTGIHHKNLIFVLGLGKFSCVGRGDSKQLLTVFHPIQNEINSLFQEVSNRSPVLASRIPAGQVIDDLCQFLDSFP
jgi:hypothetical protein